jgi:hypothetical protein
MAHAPDHDAVLIVGAYGTGKTSVAIEMAGILEDAGLSYALLDLDFQGWVSLEDHDEHEHPRFLLANLAAVVSNYRAAGVRFFVLAGFVGGPASLQAIRDVVDMPLRVVRLEVPWPEIERRLRADVTTGRQHDLRESKQQLASAEGVGLEDRIVQNDRPLQEVATELVGWLGWDNGPR